MVYASLAASDALSELHDALLRFAPGRGTTTVTSDGPTAKIVLGTSTRVSDLVLSQRDSLDTETAFAAASINGNKAEWHVETPHGTAWAGQVWRRGRGSGARTGEWLGGAVEPLIGAGNDVVPALRFVAQPHHLEHVMHDARRASGVDGLVAIVSWELRSNQLDVAPSSFVTWLQTLWEWLSTDDAAVEVTEWDEQGLSLFRSGADAEVRRRPEGVQLFDGSISIRQARKDVRHVMRELHAAVSRSDPTLMSTPLFAWLDRGHLWPEPNTLPASPGTGS